MESQESKGFCNVIHCPASPHVVLGCHTRIRSGATDLVSPQTKSGVSSISAVLQRWKLGFGDVSSEGIEWFCTSK